MCRLGRASGSVSAFVNDLKNRSSVLLANAAGSRIVEQVTIASTKAHRVEEVMRVGMIRHLRFEGDIGLVQDA